MNKRMRENSKSPNPHLDYLVPLLGNMKAMKSFFQPSKQRRLFGSLFEQIKIGVYTRDDNLVLVFIV